MGWDTKPGSGRQTDYDPNRFYIHSTNRHNHSTSVRTIPRTTSFPPEIVAEMAQIVDDPRTPYRSKQDLIRDAVIHRLHHLATTLQDGSFVQSFDLFLLRESIAERQHEDDELESTIDLIDTEISRYRTNRNPDGIADVIEQARTAWIPPRLKRRWQRAIQTWEANLAELT